MALSESLPRLLGSAASMLRTRLELASMDVEDELRYAIGLLLVGTLAVLSLSFGLLFAAFAVVALYWETHRIAAILGAGGLFAAVAAALAFACWRSVISKPRFMAATLDELEKDCHYTRT